MINCLGMANAEFEDCLSPDLYKDVVLSEFGVDLGVTQFRGNKKWSDRIENVFRLQGKPWTDSTLVKVKYIVGQSVSKNPASALDSHKRNSIDALVLALERMITN